MGEGLTAEDMRKWCSVPRFAEQNPGNRKRDHNPQRQQPKIRRPLNRSRQPRVQLPMSLERTRVPRPLVLRPKARDQKVSCRGSRYLIKQRTWSGGSGGERGFQGCD